MCRREPETFGDHRVLEVVTVEGGMNGGDKRLAKKVMMRGRGSSDESL